MSVADYDHSHIVPAGYLSGWAGDDGLLAVGWAAPSRPHKRLAPSVVGVRRGFYREPLADGSYVNRLDPAMSRLEGDAVSLIREIDQRWPLRRGDRATIGEFVALQFMRTPAWREWYANAVDEASPRVRAENPERPDDVHAAALAEMRSDAARHDRLVENLASIGTAFVNTRWTLLRCGRPRLATSDHPVIPVPQTVAGVTPLSPIPPGGIMATTEFRFALSPRHLLVMTWLDDHSPERIVKMTIDQVRNHNATVIEHADEQWFYHPDAHPERSARPWPPFAPALGGPLYRLETDRRRIVEGMVLEIAEADEPVKQMKLLERKLPDAA